MKPPDQPSSPTAPRRHRTPCGTLVEYGPPHLLADHATRFILRRLRIEPGDRVAEPGCGTALLSLFAARCGAARVFGTDVDPESLAWARRNAQANRLPQVEILEGSLLEPVPAPLDVVVALLPHKPGPRPFSPRYDGGFDGTRWLLPVVAQSAERLRPGGRLVLYVHELAHARKVLEAMRAAFEVRLLGEKKRPFAWEELEALTPGMREHLLARRAAGEASFTDEPGRRFFWSRLYEGVRR
jgi:precorrin-6B methylase 2